jgi:hypothetical protein
MILERDDENEFQGNAMLEIPGFKKLIVTGRKLVDAGYALEIHEEWMNVINIHGKTMLHGQKSGNDGMYDVCTKCVMPEETVSTTEEKKWKAAPKDGFEDDGN